MRDIHASLFTLLLLTSVHFSVAAEEPAMDSSHEAHQSAQTATADGHDHEAMQMEMEEMEPLAEVGVDERLGEKIPLDTVFLDEDGQEVRLGAAITKPTLVLPAYYSCPLTCTMMLANLAQAINKVPLELGNDYAVLAISFDEEEGSKLAHKAKGNYMKILRKGLPPEEWSFLTGSKESIHSFTDAIGFRFKRTGKHLFIHPNVLVALAPDGTIIRYLYGPRFLAFDIGMALTEAAKGTPGLSIRRLLTYCFDYDAEKRSYIFRSFRFLAVGILGAVLLFIVFVLRRGQSRS
jgi:protein SCO1/2